ncbi:unnamed protein product [Rangifer tarandus platyrhynchus]|uniref:Uncharacterized protein n=1 Tax=Rangifer tarandus platyrhynchus TaxID=3082113 RepID=A0AC59ZQE8_RANTA
MAPVKKLVGKRGNKKEAGTRQAADAAPGGPRGGRRSRGGHWGRPRERRRPAPPRPAASGASPSSASVGIRLPQAALPQHSPSERSPSAPGSSQRLRAPLAPRDRSRGRRRLPGAPARAPGSPLPGTFGAPPALHPGAPGHEPLPAPLDPRGRGQRLPRRSARGR